MKSIPIQRASRLAPVICSSRSVISLAALALAFVFAGPALGQPASSGPDASKAATIHVSGPLFAKEMMDELAAEFVKTGKAATLDYLRIDVASAAASALVDGRDMVLTMGRITDKDLGFSSKDRWKALGPQEYTLGARAVAIVVHARNSVDSLTMEQLQKVFSGQAAEWKVFGGEAKPIRRYGLPQIDPLSTLFHDKVLAAGRCNMLVRKKDSGDVLATLASDPQAIAFVDAVAASAAGGTVKIVAIGDGKSAVSPNAQTIKDGSYPVLQALALYVSPKASAAAQDFVQFVLAGQGDAVCRKHGFMPTLRAVRADAVAAFEKLYGADIKRARASSDANAQIALADQILQSAKTAKLNVDLVITMCESAYDLAFNASGGETLAFQTLQFLADKIPDCRFDCALRRAALYERAYFYCNGFPVAK